MNDKNLKIYYITIKDISIPILVKYITNNVEDYQYKNEYYISIYGVNELRSIIPNFSYCFYQVPEAKQVQTVFEYIDGITLYDYFQQKKKMETFHLETEGQLFLSIIFQIVCSLEIAQQTLHFTHFDLHEKNIILRRTNGKTKLLYNIFGINYRLDWTKYIATFIDFEYSCIRKKDYVISKISPNFFYLGYYSVFIPGTDLLRLFLNIKFSIMKYSQDSSNFLFYVHQFIDYVLINFFNFKVSKIGSRKALYYHSLYFFNMAFTNRIYKNPYSFLLFLKRNIKKIESIFNIHTPIWRIVSNSTNERVDCNNIQKFISIKKCAEPKIGNIFSYIENTENIYMKEFEFLQKTSNVLYKTIIPNIVTTKLPELKEFYLQYEELKSCYEYYFKRSILGKKKSFLFENETYCKDITTLYRILCSIEYIILLKEKYSEEIYTYVNLDVKQLVYL